jgi:outer membrane lipoprotein carrier protein
MRPILLRGLYILLLVILSALLSISQSAPSSTPPKVSPAPLLLHQFENKYRKAVSLEATFLERYTESGRVLRTESGRAYFRRPGKMRWEYEAPEKNLFLVDGKSAWFYVPLDHTVTRVPAKQSEDWRTPLALLAGEMKLSRICARVDFALAEKPEKDGDVVLSCLLKRSESKFDQTAGNDAVRAKKDLVILEFNQKTCELAQILVRGSGGVDLEFKFKDWKFDPAVPDSFFRFEVPRGVAIVNGELPSSKEGVNP